MKIEEIPGLFVPETQCMQELMEDDPMVKTTRTEGNDLRSAAANEEAQIQGITWGPPNRPTVL